jgi:hypothetical protein
MEHILEVVKLILTENRCCHSNLSGCSNKIAIDFGHGVLGPENRVEGGCHGNESQELGGLLCAVLGILHEHELDSMGSGKHVHCAYRNGGGE